MALKQCKAQRKRLMQGECLPRIQLMQMPARRPLPQGRRARQPNPRAMDPSPSARPASISPKLPQWLPLLPNPRNLPQSAKHPKLRQGR